MVFQKGITGCLVNIRQSIDFHNQEYVQPVDKIDKMA